ncbi:MAG: prolyl oligopeptidase family serine peptidase, partial [Tsuneonella sp.]
MPLSRFALAAALAAAVTSPLSAQDMSAPQYPETRRGDVVEEQFGEKIADPYRWLENDVRTDPEVAAWVAAENKVTEAYLAKLPGRQWFKDTMTRLYDYERFGAPELKGGRLFYGHNSGLQNQSVLMVADADGGDARVLIDPNGWAKDSATALGETAVSDDGRTLAYTVQDGGTDWRTLKFLSVDGTREYPELLQWVKFSGLAWAGNDGVVYSRFPEPEKGETYQAVSSNQSLWYHKLGTPQSADVRIDATPDNPRLYHTATVTSDGKWLVESISTGSEKGNGVTVARVADGKTWNLRPIVTSLSDQWSLVDGIGDQLWFVTSKDAPLKKIVRVDLSGDAPVFSDAVAQADVNLENAALVGERIVASYYRDVKAEAKLFDLQGKAAGKLDLPGIGSVGAITGKPGNPVGYFSFSGFTQPSTVYRFDSASGAMTAWNRPKLTFDPAQFETRQVFYPSRDGTKIPMFIVAKKGTAGPRPTLLYGYGGFNVPMWPSFSPSRLAWMEAGGVFALANIRGGGEYGEAWHLAGKGPTKQNVFDDFIAAGEYLKANGVTSPHGLAIQGGSNGGLLVGAVVNQRPDLIDAANAAVGVMDMLRFDRFTAGREWVFDYGYPEKQADWKLLRAYSPYHNIRSGVNYPAVIVTTADTDDRVVPGHSFK